MKFYLLVIVACVLFIIFAPIGWVVALFFKGRKDYFWRVALSIDQTGNVICGKLFDLTLRKPNGYSFGEVDRTISYALGRNKLMNTLTGTGKALDWLLDIIDKEHTLNAVKSGE
jgi:8-oxo-dGTP diphosphatase